MLSSDRLRTTHADDHDEVDLWERLRSEATRRSSMIPAAPSESPAQFEDYGSALEGELQEEYASDSDLPPSPYEGAQRFVQSSYPPPRQSYAHTQQEYSETAQLAQYEAQQVEQYDYEDGEQVDEGYAQQEQDGYAQQEQEGYAQDEYEAQQYAAQQYDLQRFSQPHAQQAQQFAQTAQQYGQQPEYGQQQARASLPPSNGFGQHYASQPPAAYGHVTPALGVSPAQPQFGYAQASASDVDDTGKSSRWTKPFVALAAVLAIGAAGYQFVLVPRRQAARAAELVDLQTRQAALIEQQEKEQAIAAAQAEAEQKAANEAALARADEAAAAAAAAQQAVAAATPAKAKRSHSSDDDDSSAADEKDRKRAERHERRAARAAAKAEKAESRSAKSESSSSSTSSKPSKSKKVDNSAAEESSDDPLLGL